MRLDEFCKRFAHFGDEAFLATFQHPFLLEEGRLSIEGAESRTRSLFQLREGPARIGRSTSADVCIRHEQVSNRHAMIMPPEERDGSWYLVDAGSTNGTFVNGVQVEKGTKVPLRDGTLLRLGLDVRLTFLEPLGFLRVLRRITSDEADEREEEDPLASTHHDEETDPLSRTTEHGVAEIRAAAERIEAAAKGELRLRCDPFDPLRLEEGRPVTVGRSPNGAEFVLPHQHVSRQHCVFERKGDRVFLRDCGSSNGTFVCQVRIGQSPTEVLPGKPISIGPFTVYVEGKGGAVGDSDGGHTLVIDPKQHRPSARHEVEMAKLVDTLQEIETEQRTGALEVQGDGLRGRIVFRSGEPWSATASDGTDGVAAIQRMLQLEAGTVGIQLDDSASGERTITMSFGEILLDDFLLKES